MNKTDMVGKAQTVLGTIDANELGVTLPHEHLLIDLSIRFQPPETVTERTRAAQSVSLENLGWVHYHPMSNMDNLQLTDEKLATQELLLYKNFGGNSLVDMSNIGLGRDPLALARISRATGINIIMGSGYYSEATWPGGINPNEDEMVEKIVSDITIGVGRTGIRSGMIGEIGTEWPITEGEKRSLRAAARAQKLTGSPINVHSGNSPDCPFHIIDILGNAGADISRVAISHCDTRIFDYDILVRLAKTGCHIEYDCFGFEGWYERRMVLSESNPIKCDVPNDATRINTFMKLIDDGYLSQLLMSHDICMKYRLRRYGGSGYVHILENDVPLMQSKGMTHEQIYTLLVGNPSRFLQFVAPTK